jgi:uncharacterized protein YyaL (SSP411 family)
LSSNTGANEDAPIKSHKDKARLNRLAKEKSPYLLQHATNPVDWFPWGTEALEKAKKEDKPIFLSVGYSSCHWCHVMENESFEDEQIAKILNENFVPIKVDREERPDIDEIYMKAVMSLTGTGGWPMNVFLTPELKPFYGGTYFPPEDRMGMPGFRRVLESLAQVWKNDRNEVEHSASQATQMLSEVYQRPRADKSQLSKFALDACYASLVESFDEQQGGFGSSPKFPMPTYLSFLLKYYASSKQKKTRSLEMVLKSLRRMAHGGIFDQLGYGFHRYSTDRSWLVPHFEKMLYDNSQLAKLYLEAYVITKDDFFKESAAKTLSWILEEMTDSQTHGFYSGQDADSPEGEGAYFVWTMDEVNEALGNLSRKARMFSTYYGVSQSGNFENGKNILHVTRNLMDIEKAFGVEEEEAEKMLEESRHELLKERLKRPKPLVDDKVLTSWNALAISALAYAFQVTQDERYLEAARGAANFILTKLTGENSHELLHRYRDGESAIDGTLEDYAFLVGALIDLFESDFDPKWLEEALAFNGKMVELFHDKALGGFYLTKAETKDLVVRPKEATDGVIPSGNSVAAMNLLRLAEFSARVDLRDMAERTITAFWSNIEFHPTEFTSMLQALDYLLGKTKEVVLVYDEKSEKEGRGMVNEVYQRYIPNKILVVAQLQDQAADRTSRLEKVVPTLLEGKTMVDGKPTAYVCEGFSCKKPATALEELKLQLDAT